MGYPTTMDDLKNFRQLGSKYVLLIFISTIDMTLNDIDREDSGSCRMIGYISTPLRLSILPLPFLLPPLPILPWACELNNGKSGPYGGTVIMFSLFPFPFVCVCEVEDPKDHLFFFNSVFVLCVTQLFPPCLSIFGNGNWKCGMCGRDTFFNCTWPIFHCFCNCTDPLFYSNIFQTPFLSLFSVQLCFWGKKKKKERIEETRSTLSLSLSPYELYRTTTLRPHFAHYLPRPHIDRRSPLLADSKQPMLKLTSLRIFPSKTAPPDTPSPT